MSRIWKLKILEKPGGDLQEDGCFEDFGKAVFNSFFLVWFVR